MNPNTQQYVEAQILRYRHPKPSRWVAGGGTHVEVTEGPVKVEVKTKKLWHSRRSWSCTSAVFNISIPDGFEEGLTILGLPAVVDGCALISAVPVEDRVYSASWIEQGVGFELRLVVGYIGIAGATAVLASTITGAKASLSRQCKKVAVGRLTH